MARRWPGSTVRERILATVLVLAFVALASTGGVAWMLQRSRVDEQIDSSLMRTLAEAHALADQGVDPGTGEGFTNSARLLYTMMQRQVPAENEGMMGLIGDEVRYRTQNVGVPIQEDLDFVNHLAGTATRESVNLEIVRTAERQYRYVALPVRVGDTEPGVLVLAFDRDAEMAEVNDTFRTYAIMAMVSLVLLGVVGWILAGRLLSPLRMLRETAEQISDTDLSRRIPVEGEDDLADLTRTVNDMLARLEGSFRTQRQLLDDAGHELRTPITIVRGHLELMDPSDPQDAAETRELTLRELDRMHRLADDLVLLAKAETPSFTHPEPTDVGLMLDDVLDHARQLGRRTWRLESRPEATALVDGQRLTQALLQLTANAVKFSEEGSRIGIGGSVGDGELLLWVRDEGIGIAEEDTTRIFERFARVGAGRRREGTGLGLPIVAAITAGHGGRVTVDSTLGAGSCFTLRLPASITLAEPDEDEVIVEDVTPGTDVAAHPAPTHPAPAPPPADNESRGVATIDDLMGPARP